MDGCGRSACVIFDRVDAGGRRFAGHGSARGWRGPDCGLGAPSGQAAVAEAARKEKVCEQPIGRCKAGVTEAGKTAPATGKSRPVDLWLLCEAEIEDLASHRAGQRPTCSSWKSGGSCQALSKTLRHPTVEGMPASKVLQTA